MTQHQPTKLFLICIFLMPCFVNTIAYSDDCTRTALIFGVAGQDGYYLAQFLLEKKYTVHGVCRNSLKNQERIALLQQTMPQSCGNFIIHYGDSTDKKFVTHLLKEIRPQELYNLAAQTDVKQSHKDPLASHNSNSNGLMIILETLRATELRNIRFFQASSSEIFGNSAVTPQDELTPFLPNSPYAYTKVYGYWMTDHYRKQFGLFICNGILFNHESPLREEHFVTRKITAHVARHALKLIKEPLCLGNINTARDWGFAGDYVKAMWLMLQQDKPEDYIIATGETHTVREFVEAAYSYAGIKIIWHGSGIDEVGRNTETGEILVTIDSQYFRPTETVTSVGSNRKAHEILQWQPKTLFSDLVALMVAADIYALAKISTSNNDH